MRFTDGFWQLRAGVEALYAEEAYDLDAVDGELRVTAPTKVIARRGDVLNRPTLTVTVSSPLPGVARIRVEHFHGAAEPLRFVANEGDRAGMVTVDEAGNATLHTGDLTVEVRRGAPWSMTFRSAGRELTRSGHRSLAFMRAPEGRFLNAQLDLGVGELVYGLGERFGPLVRNGQSVEIWNADGGTSSEQAYKNVPFFLSNRGYGVLVNDTGRVSFEVGSEAVERVQFSVPGESLEYFVVDGPTPAAVLERYTELGGRPARVPAWSYGLWLTTSFTTSYDEATVSSFIDGMAERRLPMSVFHFDCFWMREFQWCDFDWDPRTFPDPEGMLERLHDRGLRVSVWINPYIGQRSRLFAEGAALGYLLHRPDGSVWQSDLWQAGMGLVDFTDPDATRWYQDRLRTLLDQGVDCFKTDFGERIPTDVVYHDGSDPERMHNLYTQLYNAAVHEVLVAARGEGEAVLFARSATAGGQQYPVHWGGDSTSTFASMAETLRGGLSLALSGFGFWSHDIGGFEGMPDPAVFKRWVAFGLLSSHSRLHGSDSYRVPWLFDVDPATGETLTGPQSAVDVTRRFTELKLALMPYLYAAGLEASRRGLPVMRPMVLEFPDDPAVAYLDRQYMLGHDLLVAPVFSSDGAVELYLPAGTWTSWWTGEVVQGGRWLRETHGFDTVPLYVRPGAVVPVGAVVGRPDHPYLEGLTLRVFAGAEEGSQRVVRVTEPDGRSASFTVTWTAAGAAVTSDSPAPFAVDDRSR